MKLRTARPRNGRPVVGRSNRPRSLEALPNGDKRVLKEGYRSMRAYVDYMTRLRKETLFLGTGRDWLDDCAGGGGRRVPGRANLDCRLLPLRKNRRRLGQPPDNKADFNKVPQALAEQIKPVLTASSSTPKPGSTPKTARPPTPRRCTLGLCQPRKAKVPRSTG